MPRGACWWVLLALVWPGCAPPSDDTAGVTRPGDEQAQPIVPPGYVLITIDRFEFDRQDRSLVSLALSYQDESLNVSAGPPVPGAPRLAAFAARPGVAAALRADRGTSTRRTAGQSFMLLTPGSHGSLELLTTTRHGYLAHVPHAPDPGGVIERIVDGTAVDVYVDPPEGDIVPVLLEPFFHTAKGASGDGEVIGATALATRLQMPDGVPVVVMTDRATSSVVAEHLLSRRVAERETEVIVVLTARIGR